MLQRHQSCLAHYLANACLLQVRAAPQMSLMGMGSAGGAHIPEHSSSHATQNGQARAPANADGCRMQQRGSPYLEEQPSPVTLPPAQVSPGSKLGPAGGLGMRGWYRPVRMLDALLCVRPWHKTRL